MDFSLGRGRFGVVELIWSGIAFRRWYGVAGMAHCPAFEGASDWPEG
jgi:hypothetical protein